jgi:hypothetical protein
MKEQYIILKNIQDNLLESISNEFKRDIYENINWKDQIIGLI